MVDKPNLRGELAKVLVPKERVISSGRGCWNCIHWDQDAAKPRWTAKRQSDLNTALEISLKSPKGEEDQRVFNIRAMVNSLDHLVATRHVGVCHGGGRTADGKDVGDFVTHAFLCDRWTGRTGASLATQGKADPLPEERAEQMNGTAPKNVT
jgi:hypothetical protein